MEADLNREMVQTMQQDCEALEKTTNEAKKQLELSQSEVRDKEQTIRKLQNATEDLKMTSELNQELLQECKTILNAKDQKVEVLTSQLENCREQANKHEKQTSELQKIVREQADQIASQVLNMPPLDLSGLVDPQNTRDIDVLEQEKEVLLDQLRASKEKERNYKNEVTTLAYQNDELREELENKDASTESYRRQLEASEERYKLLLEEKDNADDNTDFSENTNRDLQDQLADPERDELFRDQTRLLARTSEWRYLVEIGHGDINNKPPVPDTVAILENKLKDQQVEIKRLESVIDANRRDEATNNPSHPDHRLQEAHDRLVMENHGLLKEKELRLKLGKGADPPDDKGVQQRRLMQQANKLAKLNENLEFENSSLRSELRTAENKINELGRAIQSAKKLAQEHEKLVDEHAFCEHRANEKARAVEHEMNILGKSIQELNQISVDYEDLKEEHAYCSNRADERVHAAEHKIKELSRSLEGFSQLSEDHRALKAEHAHCSSSANERVRAAEHKIKELSGSLQRLNQLSLDYEDLKAEHAHCSSISNERVRAAENKVNELSESLRGLNQLAADYEDLKTNYEDLKAEHTQCRNETDDEFRVMKRDLQKSRQSFHDLALQYEKLNTEYAVSSAINDRVVDQDREIEEYKTQLEDITLTLGTAEANAELYKKQLADVTQAFGTADADTEERIAEAIAHEREEQTKLEERLRNRDYAIKNLELTVAAERANATTLADKEREKHDAERKQLEEKFNDSLLSISALKSQLTDEWNKSNERDHKAGNRIITQAKTINELNDQIKELGERVTKTQKTHDSELKDVQKKHQHAIKDMQKKHDSEFKDIQKKHESEIKGTHKRDQKELNHAEKKLQAEIKSLKQSLDPTRRKVDTLTQAKNKLEEKCTAKDARIAQLERERKHAVDEAKTKLEEKCAAKDAKITQLEREKKHLADADEAKKKLEEKCTAKDAKIAQLERDRKHLIDEEFEERVRLSEEAYRGDMHEEFREKWRDMKRKLKDQFKEQLERHDQRHQEELTKELETQRTALRKTIAEEIEAKYSADMADLTTQKLTTLQENLAAKVEEVSDWRGKIERRDAALIAVKKELSEQQVLVQERNIACAEYEEELDGYVKQVVEQNEKLTHNEAVFKRLNDDLKAKVKEAEGLKARVDELNSLLRALGQ